MTDTTTVDIRARAAGFVRASASDFHGRRVIVVDAQGEELAGALSPTWHMALTYSSPSRI